MGFLNYIFKSNTPEDNKVTRTFNRILNDKELMDIIIKGETEVAIVFYPNNTNEEPIKSSYKERQSEADEVKIELLKRRLSMALEKQDYWECAKLRDQINGI